ncbi:MAG: sulfite exporter TauE/SafE family protein [Patescibacteria group bacterium]|jgi:hypothetical protein
MTSLILIAFLAGMLNGVGSSGGALMLLALISSGFTPMVAVFVNKTTCLFGGAVSVIKLRKHTKKEKLFKTLITLLAFSVIGSGAYLIFDEKSLSIIFSILIAFLIYKLVRKEKRLKFSRLKYFSAIAGAGLYNGIFGVGMIPITASVFKNFRGFSQIESIANAILMNFLSDFVLCGIFIFGFNLLEVQNIIPTILSMIVSISLGNYFGSSLALRIDKKWLKLIQLITLFALLVFLVLKYAFN